MAPGYDPSSREKVFYYLMDHQGRGEVPTGILYLDPETTDMHTAANTVEPPLATLPFEKLCPGRAALDKLQDEFR